MDMVDREWSAIAMHCASMATGFQVRALSEPKLVDYNELCIFRDTKVMFKEMEQRQNALRRRLNKESVSELLERVDKERAE